MARPQRSLEALDIAICDISAMSRPRTPGLPSGTNARDAPPHRVRRSALRTDGRAPHRHRRSGGSVASPEHTLTESALFQNSCSMKTNVTACGHPASRNSAEDTIAPGDACPPSLIPRAKAGAPPTSRYTRRVPATSFGGESGLARRPGLFRVPKQPIGRPHEKTTRGGRGAPSPHRLRRRAGETPGDRRHREDRHQRVGGLRGQRGGPLPPPDPGARLPGAESPAQRGRVLEGTRKGNGRRHRRKLGTRGGEENLHRGEEGRGLRRKKWQ